MCKTCGHAFAYAAPSSCSRPIRVLPAARLWSCADGVASGWARPCSWAGRLGDAVRSSDRRWSSAALGRRLLRERDDFPVPRGRHSRPFPRGFSSPAGPGPEGPNYCSVRGRARKERGEIGTRYRDAHALPWVRQGEFTRGLDNDKGRSTTLWEILLMCKSLSRLLSSRHVSKPFSTPPLLLLGGGASLPGSGPLDPGRGAGSN